MKTLNYIILILIFIWIFSSYFIQQSLGVYSRDVYHPMILTSSLIILFVGIGGLIFDKDKAQISTLIKALLDNNYFKIISFSICLGFLVSPIFLFIGSILTIFQNQDGITRLFIFLKKLNIIYIVPIIVIVTAIFLPSKGLSSATADQRFGALNEIFLANAVTISDTFGSDTTKYTIGDWVNTLNLNPDHRLFVGKIVSLEGFLFEPDPEQFGEFFLISRFVVRCCAADATPIGLPVLYDWRKQNLKKDSWYNVDGVFEYDEEKDILFVKPIKIEEIAPLKNPYVN